MHKQEIIFLHRQISYDRSLELFCSVWCQARLDSLELQVSNRETETDDLPQLV